jgi:hypothetical protein
MLASVAAAFAISAALVKSWARAAISGASRLTLAARYSAEVPRSAFVSEIKVMPSL